MKNPLKRLLNNSNFQIADALLLVRLGCNPDTVNSDGQTLAHLLIGGPFSESLTQEKKNALTTLVKSHNLDINKKNKEGKTPLQSLMDKKVWSTNDIMFLIELGSDPHTKDSKGQTILHRLALVKEHEIEYNNLMAITKLVESFGADINEKNSEGKTTLEIYISQNYFKFHPVLTLINLGADPNSKDHKNTPLLHKALSEEKYTLKSFLRNKKVNIDIADTHDRTALQQYMDCNFITYEIIQILLESNGYVHTKNSKGESLLHTLGGVSQDASQLMDQLVKTHHLDVNYKSWEGFTPLQKTLKTLDNSHPNNLIFLIDSSKEFIEQINQTLKSQDTIEIRNLNRLMTTLHARNNTATLLEKIRKLAFQQLQEVIRDLNPEEKIEKLLWARSQPLFCMHRSKWLFACIGRTQTVTLIDTMIDQLQPKSMCGLN